MEFSVEYFRHLLIITPAILLGLTLHECAHAWVAFRFGDPTAKLLGRVTLNPIKHLDPIGTLMLFFSGLFGWAKPVPVNPRYFKDPGRAMFWVSIAGPGTNLMLAAVFAALVRAFYALGMVPEDLSAGVMGPVFVMLIYGVIINVALAVFNMIPVPPLDGSKVLAELLPTEASIEYRKLEPYGFLILVVIVVSGIMKLISPVIYGFSGILIGGQL